MTIYRICIKYLDENNNTLVWTHPTLLSVVSKTSKLVLELRRSGATHCGNSDGENNGRNG